MRTRAWTLLAAGCLTAAAAGCPEEKKSSSGTTLGYVAIDALKTSVVANGANTVTVNVTNTTGAAVTVQTDRGTFPGNAKSTSVAAAGAALVLTTCNAATDASCAGTATVTVSGGASFASDTIAFGALATMCASNCAVDAGCPTLACLGTSGTGTCSSTAVSSCVVDSGGGGSGGGGGGTTGTASGITVAPTRSRVPPDGVTTTDVVVTVVTSGTAVSGATVTLATTAGTLSATTGTTGADGTATFTLTAPASAAVAKLTATTTSPAYTGTATVTFPRLGAVLLAEPAAVPAVLGVKGSGVDEAGFFNVQVVDDTGAPYPDGVAVRFEHRQLGGSTFAAPTVACVPAATGCVASQALTSSGADAADSRGLAAARIYSGTVAGTLAVTAIATVGGVTRTAALPTMAVVGARANGANLSIVCSPRNVPALAETDCAHSLVDAPFTCMALLEDRYGNLLGTSTQVVFMSEAAAVGQIATTPAYDPAADPVSQADLGSAVQVFSTLGYGLPFDVPAQPAEPSSSHGLDGCGVRTHNPRDGAVSVIAIADGEEAFFDANGNGAYDFGEPFVDQGEPFVDANDDGAWNAGEAFHDADGNGTYTPGNATWDGVTKIWTQTVVVYTGVAATVPGTATNVLGTRWSATLVAGCTETPSNPTFVAAAGNPPGTATRYVYASDLNLNRLNAGTRYATEVVKGKIAAKYHGLATYADDLGFFSRYWPCDKAGNCASQCRASGANLPCVMTPSLSAFSCGIGDAVEITGAPAPDPGTDEVDWDVSVPYAVYGTNKTSIHLEPIFGTSP